jgi:hypothetical protein
VPSDPDALWKPGFAGEVVYPTRHPVPTRRPVWRPRTRWFVAAAAGVTVVVGAAAIAWPRDDATAAVADARLPTSVAPRWTTTVPGQVWDLTATDDVVLAAAHGSQLQITALSAATGAELWSRRGDDAALAAVGVIGDTALFLSSPTRGDDDLVGLDARTGAERWRRPQLAKDSTVMIGGHHLVVTRSAIGPPARIAGVDLIDPRDGSVRASIDGPDVRLGRDDVQVRDGDTFDVYDLDTFERTAHLAVPALAGAAATLARADHGTVAIAGDRALLLGTDGTVVDEVTLHVTEPITAPVAFGFGNRVATRVGQTLTVLELDGGRMRTAWSRDVQVLDATFDGIRPLLAVAPAGAADQSVADVPIDVVDANTGERVWSGHADQPRDGPLLTTTGFVATRTGGDRAVAERVLEGIDPAGRAMWTRPVGGGAYTVVGADALLEVRPTPGDVTSSTLTLLG